MYDTFNPEMLTLARDYRGFTQSELSKRLGITQGKLSKIESGLQGISDDVLCKLAEELDFPTKFFFVVERRSGLPTSFYRKRKTTPKKAEAWLCSLVNIYKIHLERLVRAVEVPDFEIPHIEVDDFDGDPAMVAQETRRLLRIPPGPIANLTETLENAGIVVIRTDIRSAKVDGLSIYFDKSLPPLFVISDAIPGDRLRFTLAHELGHLVMHHRVAGMASPAIEAEADEFASEFLMPAREIKGQLSRLNLEKLASLKMHWKVAMQALMYRARSLGQITQNQYKYLCVQMSRLGYRKNEPVTIPTEQPTLLLEILEAHSSSLGYSREELQSLLISNETDFRSLYEVQTSKSHLSVVR